MNPLPPGERTPHKKRSILIQRKRKAISGKKSSFSIHVQGKQSTKDLIEKRKKGTSNKSAVRETILSSESMRELKISSKQEDESTDKRLDKQLEKSQEIIKQEEHPKLDQISTATMAVELKSNETTDFQPFSIINNAKKKENKAKPNYKQKWKQFKKIGTMAIVMKRAREESEEKIRKQRIIERWNQVRRIARAAMLLSTLAAKPHDGFGDYEAFLNALGKPPEYRTKIDNDRLIRVLDRLKYFQKYNMAQKQEFCTVMQHVIIPKHQLVFREGDIGDAFYVVLVGHLQAKVKGITSSGSTSQSGINVVSEFNVGDGFGDLSLQHIQGKRTASVVSTVPSELLKINRKDFVKIALEKQKQLLFKKLRFLQGTRALEHLKQEEIEQILPFCNVKTFPVGSQLMIQGETLGETSHLAIIQRGRCTVSKLVFGDGTSVSTENARKVYRMTLNKQYKTLAKLKPIQLNLKDLGPGDSIVDQATISTLAKSSRARRSNCHCAISVTATTCVELIVCSRHNLMEALSIQSLSDLKKSLYQYPDGQFLTFLFHQQRNWSTIQKQIVKQVKCQTKYGKRKFIQKTKLNNRRKLDVSSELNNNGSKVLLNTYSFPRNEPKPPSGQNPRRTSGECYAPRIHEPQVLIRSRMRKVNSVNTQYLPPTTRPALLTIDDPQTFL